MPSSADKTKTISIWKAENLPFFLTLFIGLMGFQLNQLSENFLKSPAVSYNFKVINEDMSGSQVKRDLTCTIKNISSETSFKDLKINFWFQKHDILISTPSITLGTLGSRHDITENELENRMIEFNIGHFQPEFEYHLNFKTISNIDEEAFPSLSFTSNQTVRFVPTSPMTWLAEHYFLFNIICIITCFLIIIIYMINLNKKTK